jgi:hypothetical protein
MVLSSKESILKLLAELPELELKHPLNDNPPNTIKVFQKAEIVCGEDSSDFRLAYVAGRFRDGVVYGFVARRIGDKFFLGDLIGIQPIAGIRDYRPFN